MGIAPGAGTASLALADAIVNPLRQPVLPHWRERLDTWFSRPDVIPDLGSNIGSAIWWRGLATLALMSGAALSLLPDFGPLPGAQPAALEGDALAEARAQMIMPLAYGGDSGRRMAATDRVVPLAASPERPSIDLIARLGRGDGFARMLERAGVGSDEAGAVAALVAGATMLDDVAAGTPVDIRLGRRPAAGRPRMLESLAFRARFDLALKVERANGALRLIRQPIRVDDTPLRVRGTVGDSLYRAARAAGAPADAVQAYLRVISQRMPIGSIGAGDQFDIIVSHQRAATGETRGGRLLFAGLERDGKPRVQMLAWTQGGRDTYFEASGIGETRGTLARPVNGAVSSGFGMRRHPILGFRRMHAGMDFRAGYGAPIYAVADGRVALAGRKGGYGNFVRLDHAGGLGSGYGHMSRIAVRAGQQVRRGQVIGYVGSTGLSTGPHLHYELYRGGRPINPASVTFTTRATLEGAELKRFRAELARLKAVKPGAALTPLRSSASSAQAPVREIDRLARAG